MSLLGISNFTYSFLILVITLIIVIDNLTFLKPRTLDN